jgi:hypothetical protein
MEKLNLQFEGVSKNLRYIFTDRGIYDMVDDKTMRYESLSIIDGINILQEVQDYEYKTGQITLQEHTSNPRRAMIALSDILLPDNGITVLKEWENHFGNKLIMLNESVETLIIESRINEAWDGVKIMINEYFGESLVNWAGDKIKSVGGAIYNGAKWVKDKAVQGVKWVGDKASKAWNWIKEKASAAWGCVKDFGGCLLEGLRTAMYSYVGMAVEAFLTVTGVGAPVVIVLYGLLLVWDIYLLASGDERGSVANLFCSALGVITSGTLAPIARNLFKGAGLLTKGGTIGGFIKTLVGKGGKLGALVKTLATKLGAGVSKALGFVKQGTDWLAKNFGIKFLSNWIGKAKTWIDDIVKSASSAVGMSSKTTAKVGGAVKPKTFEKVLPNQHGGIKGHLKAGKEGIKDVGVMTKTGGQFGQDVAQVELMNTEPAQAAFNKIGNTVTNALGYSPKPSVASVSPSPRLNPNLPNGAQDAEIQALIAQNIAA